MMDDLELVVAAANRARPRMDRRIEAGEFTGVPLLVMRKALLEELEFSKIEILNAE